MEQFYFLPKPKKLPRKDTLAFIINFSKGIEIVSSKKLEPFTFVKN